MEGKCGSDKLTYQKPQAVLHRLNPPPCLTNAVSNEHFRSDRIFEYIINYVLNYVPGFRIEVSEMGK